MSRWNQNDPSCAGNCPCNFRLPVRQIIHRGCTKFGPAFAVGATLGTQLFVTRSVSVGLELNGRLWRESAPSGFRAAGQSKLSEWNNVSSAQIGAALHF